MTQRIVCVGHAAVDHHFEVQAFAPEPTKTPATSYTQLCGGMGANAALALARLGAQVRLCGRVGSDEAGRFLQRSLAGSGVEPMLEVVQGAQTSVSSVVVDARGERHIFNHMGSALHQAHPLNTAQLQGAKALLTDPRWTAGAQAALTWARAQGVFSMLDADIAPQEVLQTLVPLAQWAVFSEKGLACYAPGLGVEAALRVALQSGAQTAMVTQGERGMVWLDSQGLHHAQAFKVQAQDTTGAGDVFHAALLLALASGQSTKAATRYAAAAAAIKCTRRHGVSGTPTQEEVQAFLSERGEVLV
jgi:sulfofructose kinase